jgi:hypothetical protein
MSHCDQSPDAARCPGLRPGATRRGAGRFSRAVDVLASVLAALCLGFDSRASSPLPAGLQYNHDVRPILSDNCFVCHGPDKNQRKGKLRLDVREVAVEKGAIVPGRPDESELVKRLFTTNEDDVMPPPDTHKKLTNEQKDLLKRWIGEGAKYQPHWAYIPPTRPAVPKTRDPKWVRNPVDAFILEALESKGIKPSPAADKRTLLRRVSLDLVGLPPSRSEVAAFLADFDAEAFERQVDRLLDSPHYGERMAVPWLDTVRFADTVGYHGDQNVNVFPYRDYVIRSFNRNKPFDQFTIEQIAGDLLPNPTIEQRVATGFNRLNMMTREGGAQPKEYLAKYAADRVRTVGATWLGSTLGCAECHDHKFDPFTTKDFYQLEAFFADVRQWGVYQDYNYTPNPDLKGWSNDHPFPPEIEVDSAYLQLRRARLQTEIGRLIDGVSSRLHSEEAREAAFEEWIRESRAFLKKWGDGWASPEPSVELMGKGNQPAPESGSAVQPDRSILLSGKPAERTRVHLPLSPGWLSAIRVELLPHEANDGRILRGADTTVLSLSASLKSRDAEKEVKIRFYQADADHKDERYSNGYAIIGVADAWKTSREHVRERHTAVWLPDPPIRVSDGDELIVSFGNNPIGCLRVSCSPFAAQDPLQSGAGASLAKALAGNPSRRDDAVARAYFIGTAWEETAFDRFKQLNREVLECRHGRSPAVVTESSRPMMTRVLPRGNWQDESGAVVEPQTPHFLAAASHREGGRLTRLDLARWLVSPGNPLTARTIMNRLWKQLFGTGLSAVVDDLGLQGEPPPHPELLDWLAVEFRESGWNLKHMVRLMVTSSAYRQSSNLRPELMEIDPRNRLLACQNPRRLEAEFVRDNALAIAGLIDPDVGGPSSFPYQPAGYYANLQFPDRDYYPDRDERQYRRGVYTHWQRTFLQPMLANFDAPGREECTASRNVSNTPQQALTLLNDPTFVEASRVFAENALASGAGSDDARLEWVFQEALARPIKPQESKSLAQFLAAQREHYRAHAGEEEKLLKVGIAPAPKDTDPGELAAWTEVCRVVLNLHETITRY